MTYYLQETGTLTYGPILLYSNTIFVSFPKLTRIHNITNRNGNCDFVQSVYSAWERPWIYFCLFFIDKANCIMVYDLLVITSLSISKHIKTLLFEEAICIKHVDNRLLQRLPHQSCPDLAYYNTNKLWTHRSLTRFTSDVPYREFFTSD